MPRIVERLPCGGADARIKRLGLAQLEDELEEILTGFELRVKEEKDSNGGAVLRKLIDQRFAESGGWKKVQTGDVDWTKCVQNGPVTTCLGVEIQVSARSDLVVVDLIHLKEAIVSGRIDVGVLVLPSDRLARFLTDRVANASDGKKHLAAHHLSEHPLLMLVLEHDGPGDPLPKQAKKSKVVEYPTTSE